MTQEHLDGLEDALAQGGNTHRLQDVLAAIRSGTAQLWIEGPCVIVTEVNDTPVERELHYWLAAGTLEEVIHLSNKVMEWGREVGCTVASLVGRRGWSKLLKSEGWTHQMIVMGQRLDGKGQEANDDPAT